MQIHHILLISDQSVLYLKVEYLCFYIILKFKFTLPNTLKCVDLKKEAADANVLQLNAPPFVALQNLNVKW